MARVSSPRAFACCAALLIATAARADDVADFYRGKTLHMMVGINVGGSYDLEARLVARYMAAAIPGSPTVVVQNVVGAGGITMANQLARVAPRDGTYLGILANTLVAAEAVGGEGIQFESAKFGWIGAMAPTAITLGAWHGSGIRTLEDARRKEVVVAASAKGAITYTFPLLVRQMLGAKLRIVTGYQGVGTMILAMERGEADAVANSWAGWNVTNANWIAEKKINIFVQSEPKVRDLPGVPSVQDLAANEDDRRVMDVVLSGMKLGHPFVTAPGVPPDRLAALRAAFEATMRNPEFLREAATLGFEIDPVTGPALQAMVDEVMRTPKALLDRARPLILE